MTNTQIIAYYAGVIVTSTIIFFILRAIVIVFLKNKHKKNSQRINPQISTLELEASFDKYFKKIKTKLYIILVIITILIYITLHN